ncbi:MAG: AraC family transcriptional regulator [Putridiphycobacter sp.]|nr:AraC family transcriptional regulator [Putridiphycobacter sp.]
MSQQFRTLTPKSTILQKYIAYYYFHQASEGEKTQSYFYYPHYKNALTIYKDTKVILKNSHTTEAKIGQSGFFIGYTQLTKHAAKAIIHPPFNKIGVVFHPLGLNHFLENDFSELVKSSINLEFNIFKPSINNTLQKVFASENFSEKVDFLDKFFLKMKRNYESPKLQMAIELMLETNTNYTVNELAQKLNISRKTLLRLFRRHLNCSAIDYKKLIQFRKAVQIFQESIEKMSFTDVAYRSDYYDQTEFIRHFKQLTGFNPKAFFKNLRDYGDKGTYWTFE